MTNLETASVTGDEKSTPKHGEPTPRHGEQGQQPAPKHGEPTTPAEEEVKPV